VRNGYLAKFPEFRLISMRFGDDPSTGYRSSIN